jgi:hypothetical protein
MPQTFNNNTDETLSAASIVTKIKTILNNSALLKFN